MTLNATTALNEPQPSGHRKRVCSSRDALADIVSFVRADSTTLRLVAVLLLLLVIVAVMNAAAPVFLQRLVDHFAYSRKDIPLLLAAAYIGVQGIAKGCGALRWRFYGRMEQRLYRRLALRLFDHVHSLSLQFHLDRHTGSLQHTVGNGLLGYQIVLQNALYVVIPLLLELICSGAVILAFLPPAYIVILLLVAALHIFTTVRGVERNQSFQRRATAVQVEASGLATDSYLNYETIKYFNCADRIRRRFDDALLRCAAGWTAYYDGRMTLGLVQTLCLTAGLGVTLAFALWDLSHDALTVGGLVLVTSYYLQITHPLEGFGLAYREIATGLNYSRQALELMREFPEIRDQNDAKPLHLVRGEVSFDNVDFAYNTDRPILQGVSFRIAAGRTLAVVGPSGSGKSTLCRLLFRFYDVTGGTISIDGQPLTSVSIDSLRKAIAIVPQDTILFNDTIAMNIGIAKPNVTRDEIQEAARLAGIADLIESLPARYDEVVGERGLKLSGGERQRIGIARAVLKRPRILIFDEATSSLDSETEQLIQHNIIQVTSKTTTMLITHRLSTVTHADEILVLMHGHVVERGSHVDLLARKGVYAAMWRTQQQERNRFIRAGDNDVS